MPVSQYDVNRDGKIDVSDILALALAGKRKEAQAAARHFGKRVAPKGKKLAPPPIKREKEKAKTPPTRRGITKSDILALYATGNYPLPPVGPPEKMPIRVSHILELALAGRGEDAKTLAKYFGKEVEAQYVTPLRPEGMTTQEFVSKYGPFEEPLDLPSGTVITSHKKTREGYEISYVTPSMLKPYPVTYLLPPPPPPPGPKSKHIGVSDILTFALAKKPKEAKTLAQYFGKEVPIEGGYYVLPPLPTLEKKHIEASELLELALSGEVKLPTGAVVTGIKRTTEGYEFTYTLPTPKRMPMASLAYRQWVEGRARPRGVPKEAKILSIQPTKGGYEIAYMPKEEWAQLPAYVKEQREPTFWEISLTRHAISWVQRHLTFPSPRGTKQVVFTWGGPKLEEIDYGKPFRELLALPIAAVSTVESTIGGVEAALGHPSPRSYIPTYSGVIISESVSMLPETQIGPFTIGEGGWSAPTGKASKYFGEYYPEELRGPIIAGQLLTDIALAKYVYGPALEKAWKGAKWVGGKAGWRGSRLDKFLYENVKWYKKRTPMAKQLVSAPEFAPEHPIGVKELRGIEMAWQLETTPRSSGYFLKSPPKVVTWPQKMIWEPVLIAGTKTFHPTEWTSKLLGEPDVVSKRVMRPVHYTEYMEPYTFKGWKGLPEPFPPTYGFEKPVFTLKNLPTIDQALQIVQREVVTTAKPLLEPLSYQKYAWTLKHEVARKGLLGRTILTGFVKTQLPKPHQLQIEQIERVTRPPKTAFEVTYQKFLEATTKQPEPRPLTIRQYPRLKGLFEHPRREERLEYIRLESLFKMREPIRVTTEPELKLEEPSVPYLLKWKGREFPSIYEMEKQLPSIYQTEKAHPKEKEVESVIPKTLLKQLEKQQARIRQIQQLRQTLTLKQPTRTKRKRRVETPVTLKVDVPVKQKVGTPVTLKVGTPTIQKLAPPITLKPGVPAYPPITPPYKPPYKPPVYKLPKIGGLAQRRRLESLFGGWYFRRHPVATRERVLSLVGGRGQRVRRKRGSRSLARDVKRLVGGI